MAEKTVAKAKGAEPQKAAPAKAAKPAKAKKPERAVKADPSFDPWTVLRHPHLAEKSVRQVDSENRLVFLVRKTATRNEVREAVEKGFGVPVLKVNMQVTPRGDKKASVTLGASASALDIATRLGML